MFPPPPVQGLGTTGGFKLQLEDRGSLGYEAMDAAVKAFMAKASPGAGAGRHVHQLPGQRAAALRRHRPHQGAPARRAGDRRVRHHADLPRQPVRRTTSTSSAAPTRVRVQADAPYRARAEDVGLLKVRSTTGEMVPLSALMKVKPELRPGARDALQRLPVGRHQRRPGARLLVGPGAGRDRAHRRRDAAQGHRATSGPS